jgi:hypothetical protein
VTLQEVTSDVPNSLIAKSENEVAMIAVGYVETDDGLGWFDQAMLYCPFCGTQVQTVEGIKQKVSN